MKDSLRMVHKKPINWYFHWLSFKAKMAGTEKVIESMLTEDLPPWVIQHKQKTYVLIE